MIPGIWKGVLCVEKAADCLEEFEKEAALSAKQEEKNKEVSFMCVYNITSFLMWIRTFFDSLQLVQQTFDHSYLDPGYSPSRTLSKNAYSVFKTKCFMLNVAWSELSLLNQVKLWDADILAVFSGKF